jgi:hypothetical protein
MFAVKDFDVMKDADGYRLLAFPIPLNFRHARRAPSPCCPQDLMRAAANVHEHFQQAKEGLHDEKAN